MRGDHQKVETLSTGEGMEGLVVKITSLTAGLRNELLATGRM